MPTPLDIEQPDQLVAYLRATGRVDPLECPRVTPLAGGVSNRTVLVERASGEAWVLKQALAKLRVVVDWYSDPSRVRREALGLTHLATLAPPGATTPLVFEDPARDLLAMAAVPRPHENWKTLLLAGRVEPDHVRQFADLLAAVHRNGWRRRAEMAAAFADRSFFESLRLEPYYAYAAERVPEAAGFLSALIADTRGRRLTVVHGDYSPKNVLVRPAANTPPHGANPPGDVARGGGGGGASPAGRLVLLDHEVIHFGDPAFDLGFALTHLLSKAHHLPAHRGAFADAAGAFWRTYRASLGDDVPWAADLEPAAVRHALGCLLARVAGRSPLEYLDPAARGRQRAAVVALMAAEPATVAELVRRFVRAICTEPAGRPGD